MRRVVIHHHHTGDDYAATVSDDTGLSYDGSGGATFDSSKIADKAGVTPQQQQAIQQGINFWDDQNKTVASGFALAGSGAVALGATAAFGGFVAALPIMAYALASLIPTEHAVTNYPQWVSPQVSWTHTYCAGQNWGQFRSFDTPAAGSFEEFFYAATYAALQKKHDAHRGDRLTHAELATLLAATIQSWNQMHGSSITRAVSRGFHQDQSFSGTQIMGPDDCDPISVALPAPNLGTMSVSFQLNEGPKPIYTYNASDRTGPMMLASNMNLGALISVAPASTAAPPAKPKTNLLPYTPAAAGVGAALFFANPILGVLGVIGSAIWAAIESNPKTHTAGNENEE